LDKDCLSYSAAYGAISYIFKGYCDSVSRKTDNICYNSYR